MQIDAVSPCKEMVRFWLRVLTPRGRRIYLVLASGLFLLSISLLVARSWKLKSAAGNFLYHEELQRTAEEIGSSFYYEPHKEAERVFSHKESKGGLTWFVQVSDIHLRLGAEEEVQQFREFVEDAVTILKPAAVLVTGDLTNSKTYGVKLKEIPQEWAIYKHSVRDRLNVNVSTLWLDIAGNHDNFDEVNHSHFKSHAVQVSFENTQTARRIIVTDGDGRNITLIPVDASLKPGIRAYNFLGYLPDHEFRELQRAAKEGSACNAVPRAQQNSRRPWSVLARGGLQQELPHLLAESGPFPAVELLSLLEVPLLLEASQTQVDDRRSHSRLGHFHAHVIFEEVHVRHAGLVHAVEGAAQLLEDVLQLGGGEQPFLHGLPQSGTGKAAHGDVVLVLDHDGLQLLQPLLPLEHEQGLNLPHERPVLAPFHPLRHQLLVCVREERRDPLGAAAQFARAPAGRALQVLGLGPQGRRHLPQELVHR
ncbi:putative transmembrane protein 62-like [Penaeus vannamei]|uniref:Putative transmembrane protein 62-like n=1 Tax=Penaeus vannamei TaxID=6689 RepID=A0A3R7PT97_PENVA|nr:putative transmembrane protein 62-like [Penaeus vannamei]